MCFRHGGRGGCTNQSVNGKKAAKRKREDSDEESDDDLEVVRKIMEKDAKARMAKRKKKASSRFHRRCKSRPISYEGDSSD